VISGDELGKQVLENSPELLAQIRARFGDDVFDKNGTLRRRALGEKVFADSETVRWLTRLTFPLIYKLWRDAVAHASYEVIVFDAALLFEWGIEREFDLLLIVQADREHVLSRMQVSGRLSLEEIEARLAAQIAPDIKARKADVLLENNDSRDEFRDKIREFWTARVVPELQHRREQVNGSLC